MSNSIKTTALHEKVEAALETMRPYLRSDGGDVRLFQITEDLVVELQLLGSCETCEMSHMTMKAGLEQAIKKAVPEIQQVKAISS